MNLLEAPTPPAAQAATTLPPVVIVHGIFRDHRLMRRLRDAFTRAGRRVFTPDLTPNDGSAGINELALQLGEYLEHNLTPGERCDVIGHSMGAMVARSYVQRHGGRARVRKLVTLAAPHHGTLVAWLWRGRGVRDLRPGSPFLRDLARDVDRLDGVLVASYWTPFDAIIVPPHSSELPVGHNRRWLLPHHRAFLESKGLARDLVQVLSE
ncbi:MAG TPA: alpha/beta fold hydrolase [Opitutales bacterium]|nr:alpha/beta fold hydrolase [Opitutales bacterium]